MTYNHERAKVICPEAAKEVERLRNEVDRLELSMGQMSQQAERLAMDMKAFMLESLTEDA